MRTVTIDNQKCLAGLILISLLFWMDAQNCEVDQLNPGIYFTKPVQASRACFIASFQPEQPDDPIGSQFPNNPIRYQDSFGTARAAGMTGSIGSSASPSPEIT